MRIQCQCIKGCIRPLGIGTDTSPINKDCKPAQDVSIVVIMFHFLLLGEERHLVSLQPKD